MNQISRNTPDLIAVIFIPPLKRKDQHSRA
jgi:hypothetical protein